MKNEEVKETQVVPFKLPKKKVRVSPVKRQGKWLSEDHSGQIKTYHRYLAPLKSKDRIADVLTKAEREYFEPILDQNLNPMAPIKKNYWATRSVTLTDETIELDLSDPSQYIDYKILMLQKEDVAPDGDSELKRPYKYVIKELGFDEEKRSNKASRKKEAYKYFGTLNTVEKMSNFLTVYYQNRPGKHVPADATHTWLDAELDNIIETDTDSFLRVANDKNFETKLFINKALAKRAIYKQEGKFYLPEGDAPIANSMDDLLLWVKEDINSEEVLQLEAKLKVN